MNIAIVTSKLDLRRMLRATEEQAKTDPKLAQVRLKYSRQLSGSPKKPHPKKSP